MLQSIFLVLIRFSFMLLVLAFERVLGLPFFFLVLSILLITSNRGLNQVGILLIMSLLLAVVFVLPITISYLIFMFGLILFTQLKKIISSDNLRVFLTASLLGLLIMFWQTRVFVSVGLLYFVVIVLSWAVGARFQILRRLQRKNVAYV